MRNIIVIAVVTILASSCGGPFPSGALGGTEMTLAEAPAFTEDLVIQLETRPSDPYTVTINAFAIDGALYIDPAPDRTWAGHLAADPLVRINVGDDNTYAAKVYPVTDAELLARFEADRTVYRIGER